MENITAEEVMDNLDIFQSRFEKSICIWLVGYGENSN